jgi:predicted transcriptional regulator
MVVIRKRTFELIIRKVEPPFSKSVQDDLDWICQSFGFFEEIDKEKTASSVFKEIVRATEKGKPVNSTDLAKNVGMSRGSVINHLNNLIQSGLIVKDGRFYMARSQSMFRTIEEIEEDIDRIFDRMKQRARYIDEKFGIKVRE